MSVPARRKSSSSVRRRRSHNALKATNITSCAKCKGPIQPHHACSTCGTYNGRAVLTARKSAEQLIKKSKTTSETKAQSKTNKEETPKI